MSYNPITRVRFFGSVTVVILTLAAIATAFVPFGPSGLVWAYMIGGVAGGYAVLSFVLHLRNPEAIDAAWDEQNIKAHQDSMIFGYWAVLWVFIAFLILSLTGQMDAASAFYWLGPVLGAVPPAHYVASIMRGRAE
jgi:hypothetical protein